MNTSKPSNTVSTQCLIIAVEGNIGSGKTTFLHLLGESLTNAEIVVEPVELWKDFAGHNVLEAYYTDPAKYSFMFQMMVSATRIAAQLQNGASNLQNGASDDHSTPAIRVIERSGMSDYCFAKNCYESGLMTQMEFDVYDYWYKLVSPLAPKPDLVFYLRASPETCDKRIRQRARNEESGIPMEYLQGLHELHDQRFITNPISNVVVIDRDADVLTDAVAKKSLIELVKRSIEQARHIEL